MALNGAYYGPAVLPPPRYHRRSSDCCCCNPFTCICKCIFNLIFKLIFTAIIILGLIIIVLWLIFRPNPLKFNITDASLTQFDLTNSTLKYNLALNASVRNPNSRIGIYYDVIQVDAFYNLQRFSTVNLTPFYQGHKNTSELHLQFSGDQQAFDHSGNFASDKSGGVFEVELRMRLRVRFKLIKLLNIRVGKFNGKAYCDLKVPMSGSAVAFQATSKTASLIDFIAAASATSRELEALVRNNNQRRKMGLSEEKKLVCVTGASGYIASWIVKLLLQRGYNVNATVRNINDTKKVAHLLALDGAKERLTLFEADLIKEGSFDSAVQGCQGVFHTASPVLVNVTDPQAELIDPAVNGTLNVLKSCSKVPSIKRIVVTSSISSVIFNGKPLTPDVVVDESWYSDPVYCKESKLWYKLSKTLAEEAALSFAKEHELDLVTIHPGFVIGPPLQEALNITVELIVNHAKGTQKLGTGYHRFVDVRDVAAAHIQAIEIPAANGRYILVERVTHSSEVTKILSELYPELEFPLEWNDDKPSTGPYLVSKERAKTLGIDFIPVEASIRDTVESLKDK